MAYSYEQYQADRALLGVRSGIARLVPKALNLKLEDRLAEADAADREAIQAACERLMAVAEAGPEAVPLPPRRGRQTPPGTAEPPDPVAIERERAALEAWQDALRAQKERHARRRGEWPELAPPFKEPSTPAP